MRISDWSSDVCSSDLIDEDFAKTRARRGFFAGWRQKARVLKGYPVFGGRIAAPSDDWFRNDPERLIEIFQLAEAEGLEIHPETMRRASRAAGLIKTEVRNRPAANATFPQLLSTEAR